jgi:hypothetical protein
VRPQAWSLDIGVADEADTKSARTQAAQHRERAGSGRQPAAVEVGVCGAGKVELRVGTFEAEGFAAEAKGRERVDVAGIALAAQLAPFGYEQSSRYFQSSSHRVDVSSAGWVNGERAEQVEHHGLDVVLNRRGRGSHHTWERMVAAAADDPCLPAAENLFEWRNRLDVETPAQNPPDTLVFAARGHPVTLRGLLAST